MEAVQAVHTMLRKYYRQILNAKQPLVTPQSEVFTSLNECLEWVVLNSSKYLNN